MHEIRINRAYCSLLFGLCAAAAAWSQTPADTLAGGRYKFITIRPENSPYAVADGIDNAGTVTGYYQDLNSHYHGFVWRNGVFQPVNYPGAMDTLLFGVSNRGVAIGYYGDGTTNHTVMYSVRSGAWSALPDIPNYTQNDGYCINDLGVAVGNAFSSSAAAAWIWDPASQAYSFLDVPGAAQYSTSPSCLNDKNQVAGYYADAVGTYHGFIEEGGAYTTVDVPGAADTYPDGIDNEGVIQGQIFDAAFVAEGFVGTRGGPFAIVNYPGSVSTAIVGINDRGDLCGAYGAADGAEKAFIAILQ